MTTVDSHTSTMARESHRSEVGVPPTVVAPPGATPSAPGRRFRADIEGLRAVAVLSVVFFHAGVPWLPGGFVGVDVFFVISGFLITGHLVGELRVTGTIRWSAFAARRARRLLPLASVVIIATVAVYAATASSLDTRAASMDGLWSALFAMNIALAARGVDYQADQDPSPFTHFWSLGLEEQFYLVWPIVLLGTSVVLRRLRRATPDQRAGLTVVVGLLATASFAWAMHEVAADPAPSYFLLPTRAWELALGGLAALLAPRLAGRRLLQNGWLTFVGLAMIGAAAAMPLPTNAFPGAAALLPTLGASAVLVGGLGGTHRVERILLGWAPLQAIGRWSYGWYLWHWGPLVLFSTLLGRQLALPEALLLCGLTLALAAVTSVIIETPFRSRLAFVRTSRRGLILGAACVSTSLAVVTAVLMTSAPLTGSSDVTTSAISIDSGRVDIAAAAVRGAVPGNLSPSLEQALHDAPDLRAADGQPCHARIVESTVSPDGNGTCVAGGTENGSTTVMLLGDSHAHQWLPALQEIAPTRDWRLINLTKAACPLFDVQLTNNQLQRDYAECYDWRAAVWQRIDAEHPSMVIVSAAVFSSRDGDFAARWNTSVRTTLDRLRATGATVVMIADTPFPQRNIPKCLSGHLKDVSKCDFSLASGQSDPQRRAATTAAALAAGVTVVDPTAWFCDDTHCPAILGDALVYRDNSHISTVYARQVAPLLAAALPPD